MGKRALIEVSDLTCSLGGRPILRNLNLTVEENDFILVCGPNGAGKSTLMKILAGLIPVTKGKVTANEKNITRYSRREMATMLSYLPQFDDFGLPILVKDILWAGRFPYRSLLTRLSAQDRKIFSAGVARFGLDGLLERNIQTLSGGERKKVLLAGAFIQDVPIILLDEPLNFLDPASAVQLIRMLENLRDQGKTILLVSHDIERLFPSANKILALKNGERCYFGPKKFSNELFKEIYQVSFQKFTHGGREIVYLDE